MEDSFSLGKEPINQLISGFYNLTPEVVIQAVKNAGFEPTGHCMTLNSYENRVYDLMLEDESHIIIKFYRPGRWLYQQILEEHQFLFELAENDIPVCKPFILKNGSTIDEINRIYFTIWPRTGGRSADEFTDDQLAILGRLVARIHNVGATKADSTRNILNENSYVMKPARFLLENNFVSPLLVSKFRNITNEINSLYHTLSADVPLQRIHGDCHPGNLLFGEEGWFFLDFDDFLIGPVVQDFWMLVPAIDQSGIKQREIFINSYREFRDFDENWLQLIEPLRALRYIHYAYWIAKRWEDPAFKYAFPHFGTEQYWEELTGDLEHQLKIIKKQINKVSKDGEIVAANVHYNNSYTEELSNKDFFWDWEK